MYAAFVLSARYLNEGHPVADCRTTDYLRQEIAFFETRLNEMGEQGDCAYERALSRTYEVLLPALLRWVSRLRLRQEAWPWIHEDGL